MQMKIGHLFRFLFTVIFLSMASSAGEDEKLNQKDRSSLDRISEGLRRAAAFVLYEGLPHQFYETPIMVAVEDADALRRLSTDPESFSSYGGPKKCGGYHPDYCLEWKDGAATRQLHICFGCEEGKFFTPDHRLVVDIRRNAAAQFKAILNKYWIQRPVPADSILLKMRGM